ncbi:MAG TPA: glycoside hydrolase family 28 protein [Acidobacteriaceae bacterium]
MSESSRRELLKFSGISLAALASSAPLSAYAAPARAAHPAMQTIFDVRTFGATGDGKTLDTPAINRAIEAAAAVGGGTVLFPAGTYLCFSIHLKSYVDLYIAQGATILAADGPKPGDSTGYNGGKYDAPEPKTAWDAYQDFGHNHWHNSLIWGEDLHDISIAGPGLIWGRGLTAGHGNHVLPDGVGNKAIAMKNCRNIIFRDFSILKGGHFGLLLTAVDNLTIDNLKIDTDRDGIDIDCCRNVRVSNCTVNSPEDDAICPKSSFALGYARSTDNVTITNCYTTGKYEIGSLLDGTFKVDKLANSKEATGRIKCGTESNGGFRNITISNCVCEGSRGIALESADGALLEDIAITNITMRECTVSPLYIRLCARMRGPADAKVGTVRRVYVDNFISYNSSSQQPAIIAGIPNVLMEDIRLSNIYFHQIGNAGKDMADTIPDEKINVYPDPTRMGEMPSHGLFLRNIKNCDVSNVDLALLNPDARPAVWAQNVHGLDIFRLKTPLSSGPNNVVLKDVSDFHFGGSRGIKETSFDNAGSKSF